MLCAVYTSPQDTTKHTILWLWLETKKSRKKEQLRMATKKGGKKAAKKGGTKKAAKKGAKKAAKKR